MDGLLLLGRALGLLGGLVLVGLVLVGLGGLLLVGLTGWGEDDRSDFDRRWDETVDDLIVLGLFDD